jgi:rhomboid protease GluP
VTKSEPSPSLVDRAKHLVLGDDTGPTPVTNVIVALNLGIYGIMALYSRSTTALLAMPEGSMKLFGANVALFTVGDKRLETLVTSCFLHFSLLHLGFNMVALRQVGPFVERSVGPARFLPLYIVSGVLGSVTSALYGWKFNAGQISAGASGAICGVIGAAMVLGVRTQGIRGPLAMGMARWLAGIVVLGLLARFDNAAHIGGAVAGAAIAALWQRGRTYSRAAEIVVIGVMALVTVGSAAAVYWRDTRDPYVFQDEDARRRAAQHFMVRGQCDKARVALARASALHPQSADTRDMELDLMRHCP